MARFLALEWDGREARVVVARRRGRQLVVDDAFSIDLCALENRDADDDSQIGEAIGAALTARDIGRAEALVAVGRASIELRNLVLPPAPDEELPDLVRFQALRQFTTLDEDWPLDFFSMEVDQSDACHVLAAAISPELVEQIQSNCRAADLQPQRLVLRPCGVASLLRRRLPSAKHHVRLLVDLLADESDLTALDDESIIFMRTARLSGEAGSAEQSRALLHEIRRTMMAVQNQAGGRGIQQIILCGDSADHAAIKAELESELSLPVELFDPFDALPLGEELRETPPRHPGRFAPLIGILLDEAEDRAHAIDFLNPRKRAAAPSRRGPLPLAITAAATIAVAVIGLLYYQSITHADRVQSLKAEASRLEKQLKSLAQTEKDRDTIAKWTAGEISWIDELDELSAEFPSADQAIVTLFQGSSRAEGGGRIQLQGYAIDASVVPALTRALQDDRHDAYGDGSEADDKREKYQWRFAERIELKPPSNGGSPE